jgi:hypothetical protein
VVPLGRCRARGMLRIAEVRGGKAALVVDEELTRRKTRWD